MAIAIDVAYMAILHATARLICKNNRAKPQKALLLESMANIPFMESPSLQIWLKQADKAGELAVQLDLAAAQLKKA